MRKRRRRELRPIILGVAAVVVVAIALIKLPLTGPAVSKYLRLGSLGQVILSVNVINPDVPETQPSNPPPAGSSSGSSGGGGGSAPAPSKASPAPTTAAQTTVATPPSSQASPAPAPIPSVLPTPVIVFPRKLTQGTTGPDVTTLQHFLNTHGSPVAITGKGSLGKEGATFGAKTFAALLKYQQTNAKAIFGANSTSTGKGVFGPRTTAYILSVIAKESASR